MVGVCCLWLWMQEARYMGFMIKGVIGSVPQIQPPVVLSLRSEGFAVQLPVWDFVVWCGFTGDVLIRTVCGHSGVTQAGFIAHFT